MIQHSSDLPFRHTMKGVGTFFGGDNGGKTAILISFTQRVSAVVPPIPNIRPGPCTAVHQTLTYRRGLNG